MLACAEQNVLIKTSSEVKHLLNVSSLGIIWCNLLTIEFIYYWPWTSLLRNLFYLSNSLGKSNKWQSFYSAAGCKILTLFQKGLKMCSPREIQGEYSCQCEFFRLIKNKPSDTWSCVTILFFSFWYLLKIMFNITITVIITMFLVLL